MKKTAVCLLLLGALLFAAENFETDTVPTKAGDLSMTFIGHGTLCFEWNNKVVHVDPWSRLADYENLPKADLVLVTHQHGDHLDANAIQTLKKENTTVVLTEKCLEKTSGIVMKNGEEKEFIGIKVKAVPAYNIKNKRDNGAPFHPKGEGNGYVITFGDVKVYVAGDTENIPEMAELKGQIDIAFIPMNLPYTMSPEMAADAALKISPKILYPYHFGDTDVSRLVELLENEKLDVRIRKLQ